MFDSQLMEEMILYHGRISSSSLREAPSVSNDGWRSIYTLRDARSCINKIQAVRYRENTVGLHLSAVFPTLANVPLGTILYYAYHSLQLRLFLGKCELVT